MVFMGSNVSTIDKFCRWLNCDLPPPKLLCLRRSVNSSCFDLRFRQASLLRVLWDFSLKCISPNVLSCIVPISYKGPIKGACQGPRFCVKGPSTQYSYIFPLTCYLCCRNPTYSRIGHLDPEGCFCAKIHC